MLKKMKHYFAYLKLPMADELMNPGVTDSNIGLGQLPNRTLNAILSRSVDLTHSAVLVPIRMWEAELNHQWLQAPVVLQEKQSPCGVHFRGGGIDSRQIRHQRVMVVQYEEPVRLQRLQIRILNIIIEPTFPLKDLIRHFNFYTCKIVKFPGFCANSCVKAPTIKLNPS